MIWPIEKLVKYNRLTECRALLEALPGVKIINVIEIKTCELIKFIIECPKELEEKVHDICFMTFITNPKFQKYYV